MLISLALTSCTNCDTLRPKGSKNQQYNAQSLAAAAAAVQSGSASATVASSLYDVPRTTAAKHAKGPVARPGAPLHLTVEDEARLAQWVKESDAAGLGVDLTVIKESAAAIARTRNTPFKGKDGLPSPQWWSGFKDRHNIKLRNADVSSVAKTMAANNPSSLLTLHQTLAPFYQDLRLDVYPERLLNFDETSVAAEAKKSKIATAAAAARPRPTTTSSDRWTQHLSVGITMDGRGCAHVPVYIIEGALPPPSMLTELTDDALVVRTGASAFLDALLVLTLACAPGRERQHDSRSL